MRRGVGHYVKKGLGGSASAARRLGGTSRTAGALYGALSSSAAGQAVPGSPLDPRILSGRAVSDVMDAVVEAVRPVDGSQDAEASRKAIRESLSELLAQFPNADLLNLAKEHRLFAIEHFIAIDVFNRIILDVGKTLNERAPTAGAALSRMKQIKEYVRETIAAKFRSLRKSASALSARVISRLASQAMREAFGVFEDYVK
jgi:vacuolar-type H+-ATPase subunit E/Vma4